jgi:RNA polymerase sigma-70 factor (ECF subfamily)
MRFGSARTSPGPGKQPRDGDSAAPGEARDPGEDVTAALDGDAVALERLVTAIRPRIWRYCRARLGAGARAVASPEDVAQEVCLAVVTALPSYVDCGKPFLAFVYGIARNKVAAAHRAAARNREDPVEVVPYRERVPGPEATIVAEELGARISGLLSVLSGKRREILMLRVVVGLSAEETA